MFFSENDVRNASKSVKPIIIEEDGNFKAEGSPNRQTVSLDSFIKRVMTDDYDFDPPYQRPECWTPDMQANLVISVLCGRPIPAVYTASKKNNVAKCNVVDGKQRSCALLRFRAGALKIPIEVDGKVENMSYKDIETKIEAGVDRFKNLKNKFDDFSLDLVCYQGLNLVGQCGLFDDINTFRPITNDEAMLGNNYYMKAFLRVILNEIKPLLQHMLNIGKNNGKHKDKSYDDKALTYIGRILFICFGPEMTDVWQIRDLGLGKAKTMSDSRPFNNWIKKTNQYLANYIEESDLTNLDRASLQKIDCFKNIDLFVKVCDCLRQVLEFNNTVSKKIQKNDALDIICFLVKNIRDDIITLSMIKDDFAGWRKFVVDYISTKNKGDENTGDLTGQSVTTPMLKRRFTLIEKVFQRHDFDRGVKNKLQTQHQDTLARLQSDAKCPVTQMALSDDNYATDHIKPKSLSSATDFVGISKFANEKKSNLSKDMIEKLSDYTEVVDN